MVVVSSNPCPVPKTTAKADKGAINNVTVQSVDSAHKHTNPIALFNDGCTGGHLFLFSCPKRNMPLLLLLESMLCGLREEDVEEYTLRGRGEEIEMNESAGDIVIDQYQHELMEYENVIMS